MTDFVLSTAAKKMVAQTATEVDRLNAEKKVVDEQRWLVRDLMIRLVDDGVPTGVAAATILGQVPIEDDDELVNALNYWIGAPNA
jgi:hypothetical protein